MDAKATLDLYKDALQQITAMPLNVENYNSLEAIRLRFVAMQTIARKALSGEKSEVITEQRA